MLKAHKIKLRPTDPQIALFTRAVGIRRFAYNWMLARCERHNRLFGKYPNVNEVAKRFRRQKPEWSTEFGCYVYEVTDEVKQSIKMVIKNRSTGMSSKPKFASKYSDQQSFYVHNRYVAFDKDYAILSNFDNMRVKLTETLRFSGKIMGGRVTRRAGKWYLSVQVETGEELPPVNDSAKVVGVDIGSGVLATLTTGQQYPPPKAIDKHEEKLARLQQIMANKDALGQRGSKRRKKLRAKITKLHAKIADTRNTVLHQTSHDIIENNEGVSVEGYDIAKLVAAPRTEDEPAWLKTKRNKNMLDAGAGEFRRQLEYKAAWRGKKFVEGDKHAATSCTCSVCGVITSISLSRNTWKCPHCKTKHDRRLNSATNMSILAK